MSTLDALVYESASVRPHDVAVLYDNGSDTSTLTYGQLGATARSICDWLRSRGIDEEVVGVLLGPSLVLPAALTGIMSVPAAFMPLDNQAPKVTLVETMRRLNMRAVLVSENHLKDLVTKLPHVSLSTEPLEDHDLILVWIGDTRHPVRWEHILAYVITTSGSTGEPKIVKVPHSCILPNVTHIRSLYEMTHDDVSILMSPLTFDPSIVEMFIALSAGAQLLLVSDVIKMVPQKLESVIEKYRVTVMQTTPSVFANFGEERLRTKLLADDTCLRVVAFGGECCPPPSALARWRSPGNKTTLINLYGVTEVSSWASYFVIPNEYESEKDEVPLGMHLEKTILEVRDAEGQKVTEGEGHLFVGGTERVCLIGDEASSHGDVLRPTGDRVLLDTDGNLWYRGRIDRQIKRHGKRLNLDSLEQVVSRSPTINSCASVLDTDGHLYLFIGWNDCHGQDEKEREGYEDTFILNIRRYISQHLPSQYMPDLITLARNIPYTRHGKVDRNQLLLSVQRKISKKHSTLDVEELLQSSWKASLPHLPDVPITADSTWLSSGGDSFTAVHLLNLLTESLPSNPPSLLENILSGTYSDILLTMKQTQNHEEGIANPSVKQPQENTLQNLRHQEDGETGGRISVVHALKRSDVDEAPDFEPCIKRIRKSSEQEGAGTPVDTPIGDIHAPSSVCLCEKGFLALSRCNRSTRCCKHCRFIQSVRTKMDRKVWTLRDDRAASGATTVKIGKDDSFEVKPRLSTLWAVNTGKCIDASPLLLINSSQKLVFIGSHSHKFTAVSMETGEVLWEKILGDRIESSACLSPCGRYVIVGCYDGVIYVMDVSTGDLVWSFTTNGQVKCSPVADEKSSLILIGSHDQNLYALSIEERVCRWQIKLGAGSVYSSPVVCARPHVVYFGTLGGVLAATDIEKGKLLWRQTVGKPIFSSPCLVPGGVTIGCVDGKIYTFNHQGERVWTFEASGPVFSSPSYAGYTLGDPLFEHDEKGIFSQDKIVFGCHDNAIFCVNTRGQLLWKHAVSFPVFSSPFILRTNLNCGIHEKNYTHFQTNQDSQCIRNKTEASSSDKIDSYVNEDVDRLDMTNLKVDNRELVVLSVTNGRLLILDLAAGKLVVDHKFPGEIFSSPVIYQNRIYIGCRDNNLYCLEINFTGTRSL